MTGTSTNDSHYYYWYYQILCLQAELRCLKSSPGSTKRCMRPPGNTRGRASSPREPVRPGVSRGVQSGLSQCGTNKGFPTGNPGKMWKIKGWSWICPEKKSTWSDLNDLNQKENRWVQYKAKDWRFQESNGQVSSDMGFWFNIKWHWWTKKAKTQIYCTENPTSSSSVGILDSWSMSCKSFFETLPHFQTPYDPKKYVTQDVPWTQILD